MNEAGLRPEVSYSYPERSGNGFAGFYRFIGELQAIQNDSSVWINNGSVSVKAELKGVHVYLLPTSQAMESEAQVEQNVEVLPQQMPKKLNWERVYSLNQGTGVLLSGAVYLENGNPVFHHTEENPLLVIIYDGKKETVLRRSIWCGRQLNEYWNPITPVSLVAGSFCIFVYAYFLLRGSGIDYISLTAVLLSIVPVMPILPPGIIFYFLYKKLWKRGRLLRAERDLLRLPLRFGSSRRLSCASVAEAVELYPAARVRSCGVIREAELMGSECRVFLEGDDIKKTDPLVEDLIIPGEPEDLAVMCRRRARIMEISATAALGMSFVVNTILIFLVIIRFI